MKLRNWVSKELNSHSRIRGNPEKKSLTTKWILRTYNLDLAVLNLAQKLKMAYKEVYFPLLFQSSDVIFHYRLASTWHKSCANQYANHKRLLFLMKIDNFIFQSKIFWGVWAKTMQQHELPLFDTRIEINDGRVINLTCFDLSQIRSNAKTWLGNFNKLLEDV